MKRHLAQRQLLDHLFRLAAPAEAERARAHLTECPECRAAFERLRHRFAALETLREPQEASERLIAETLRRMRVARVAPERRAIWFPAFAWTAAAAAVLLAVFVAAPKLGRPPARELARLETPAAQPPSSAMEPVAMAEPAPMIGSDDAMPMDARLAGAKPESTEPPAGLLLAGGAAMPAEEFEKDEDEILEAERILSDAAGQPPGPVLAVARGFSGQALKEVERDDAARAAAPTQERSASRRERKPRPARAARQTPRLPGGWSYSPTNDIRVMLIPLKAPADAPAPGEGFTAKFWQVRILNDGPDARRVVVTRVFDRPGGRLRLLNEEGRLARLAEQETVLEADVPAGGFRALHCLVAEPVLSNTEESP